MTLPIGAGVKDLERIARDLHFVDGETGPQGEQEPADRAGQFGCRRDDGRDPGRFPTLSEDDVRAAIAFAATSAQEDLPVPELPIKR